MQVDAFRHLAVRFNTHSYHHGSIQGGNLGSGHDYIPSTSRPVPLSPPNPRPNPLRFSPFRSWPFNPCTTSPLPYSSPLSFLSLRSPAHWSMRVVLLMSVRQRVPLVPTHVSPDDRCIGMLMDWRELAGRPTFRRLHGEERWSSFTGAWSGGRKVAEGPWYMGPDGRGDYLRGWILASCWVLASTAEWVTRA